MLEEVVVCRTLASMISVGQRAPEMEPRLQPSAQVPGARFHQPPARRQVAASFLVGFQVPSPALQQGGPLEIILATEDDLLWALS